MKLYITKEAEFEINLVPIGIVDLEVEFQLTNNITSISYVAEHIKLLSLMTVWRT